MTKLDKPIFNRLALIGAGLIGGAITFAALLLPGMRAIEGREAPTSA